MSRVLVDANVLLDVLTEDEQWFDWSAAQLDACAAGAAGRDALPHLLSDARADLSVNGAPSRNEDAQLHSPRPSPSRADTSCSDSVRVSSVVMFFAQRRGTSSKATHA